METGIETLDPAGDRATWRRHLAALVSLPDPARLAPPVPLSGGALQQHWRIDVPRGGGVERFVLRRTASRVLDSLARPVEFAVQRAAFAAGVPTPEPLACGADFLLMRHVAGAAEPAAVLGVADPDGLARALAQALARLHGLTPARCDVPGLAAPPVDAATAARAAYRVALDRRPRAHPVLEWGLGALATAPPAPGAPVLCHGDFRTGNYLVADARLSAVLDWEFARWSDPHEDLGWFCMRYWRRDAWRRAAGGLVDRDVFFAHYEAAGGAPVDRRRALYWELMANLRWALIALEQGDRGRADGWLGHALSTRRLAEVEAEILSLADAWLDGDA
jgi:aminoglycoside phosphotransferase (APT) family kinase protein